MAGSAAVFDRALYSGNDQQQAAPTRTDPKGKNAFPYLYPPWAFVSRFCGQVVNCRVGQLKEIHCLGGTEQRILLHRRYCGSLTHKKISSQCSRITIPRIVINSEIFQGILPSAYTELEKPYAPTTRSSNH